MSVSCWSHAYGDLLVIIRTRIPIAPARPLACSAIPAHRTLQTCAMSSADADCCTPHIKWGQKPQGKEETLGGLNIYASKNLHTSTGPVIVLIHDIWGHGSNNLRVMCDRYAAEGFRAIAPDFYDGKPCAPGANVDQMKALMAANPMPEKLKQCDDLLAALKDLHSSAPGWQGFCWGAQPITLVAGKHKVPAAVFNHASNLTQEDVENADYPVWFNFSGPTDGQIPPEKRERYERILDSKGAQAGYQYFPEAKHGWTLKGDDKDPQVAKDAQAAFQNSLAWFKKHLK